MPIRIYALAKELKIDSKQLVEICDKAGVTGKGSALASLDDDEITKIKGYLAGGKRAKPVTAGAPGAAAPRPENSPENSRATTTSRLPARPFKNPR